MDNLSNINIAGKDRVNVQTCNNGNWMKFSCCSQKSRWNSKPTNMPWQTKKTCFSFKQFFSLKKKKSRNSTYISTKWHFHKISLIYFLTFHTVLDNISQYIHVGQKDYSGVTHFKVLDVLESTGLEWAHCVDTNTTVVLSLWSTCSAL